MTPILLSLIGLLVILLILFNVKKIRSNQALVITRGHRQRIAQGKWAFLLPVLDKAERIRLAPLSQEIKIKGALTQDNIPIACSLQVRFKVKNDEEAIFKALKKYRGLDFTDIQGDIGSLALISAKTYFQSARIDEIFKEQYALDKKLAPSIEKAFVERGLELIGITASEIFDKETFKEIKVVTLERDRELETIELQTNQQINRVEQMRDAEIEALRSRYKLETQKIRDATQVKQEKLQEKALNQIHELQSKKEESRGIEAKKTEN